MASLVELFDNTVQFQDFNGVPLAGGRLFVYALGRTRMMDSWSDIGGQSLNSNPVIIDNVGQARVYVSPDFDYTIVVQDRYGKEIFSLDKYVMSGGDISHADVVLAPSETIGVSSYRAGDVTVYVPYLEADVGKVYSGIEPIVVNNVEDKISANTASFGVESPLYLSEDSSSATVVALNMSELEAALTGKADTTDLEEIRDNMMSATALGGVDNIITGYNGSAFSAGSTYSGIDPVYVDNENKTISVSSKELEAVAPLLITETDTAYQLSITANINSPRTRVIEYGTDRWDDVKSAMDDMSAGNIDYVVMRYTDASGNEYYAPLDKYTPDAACHFVCPSNEQDTVYGYGQRRKDTIFTINSGDLWVTRNVRPFIGRVIGGTNVTVDVQGEDYVLSANGIDASASEAIDLVTANSGNWNEVSAKLDTTAFSTVSGDFITALPDSANWNSTYDTVSDNSGSWGSLDPSASEAIELVTANSGTWNTVTDKLDTTAFSTVSGDFVTALSDSANWNSTYNTVYSNSGTWDTVTSKLDTTALSTVSGDFVTALPDSGNWNSTYNTVNVNSASWSSRPQLPITGVNIDIYEADGKIVFSGMTGGSTYTGDAQGALDKVYANSGDWNTVTNKLDTTAFSTVSGDFITSHQALPESANWNSTYNTVYTNSGSWTGGGKTYTGISPVVVDNTADTIAVNAKAISVETPLTFNETSTAFVFGISGTDKWDSTYDTVHDNSASWTGGGATLPVSGAAGDNSAVYGLYNMKIEYNLPSVGGSEPDHAYARIDNVSVTVHESTDEDQSYNEIIIRPNYIELYNPVDGYAYMGAANVLSWQSTYNTVHDNSGNWTGGGGSTYTGDAQGALDEVYTNSGSWNTVTGKLDTTAQKVTAVGIASVPAGLFWQSMVSSINSLPILPYGYATLSGNSAKWNSTYNTVRDNSASWTGGGGDFTGLFQAQYGTTTYSDIKNAVDNHKVVYCQSGGRMAFLAYSGSNNYEFQYYRSLTGHTTAAQGDQVFVYTISNNNTWGVTTRNTYTEIKPSAGLTSAFTNGAAAKLTFRVSDDILNATASVAANSANWQSAYDQLGNVTALLDSL